MTDTQVDRKWFYRTILAACALAMSHALFQPQYNFAHLIPHGLLRILGVSYDLMLLFEQHADKLLHLIGAMALTLLIIRSQFPFFSEPRFRAVVIVSILAFTAELIQWNLGRGFDAIDLIIGVLGSYWSYRLINWESIRI